MIADEINHLPEAKIRYQDHVDGPKNYRVNFKKGYEILGLTRYSVKDGF